ncbi:DUF6059 family protein [Streptomyces sp. NPDC006527]|uniref:DUF6059 family protein n=1 Tax=Streptomyces sp. NPDC006527 TaxID=3364749 RepID=UPI00368FEFA0
MRSFLTRFLRSAQETLIAFGNLWVYVPPVPESPESPEAPLGGPAPGHPEALRPDIPLSAVERALHRQFLGAHPGEGTGPGP